MSVRVNSSPSNLERAEAAWSAELPGWIRALALACDRDNQRSVAAICGFPSHPEVGRILKREHTGCYAEAEARVRAALVVVDATGKPISPTATAPAHAADLPLQPATNLGKAIAAWGAELPRWVRLLAEAADASSQTIAAARLAKSSTWVSRIVNRSYAGSYSEAEEQVLARLGGEEVACPIWANCSPIPLISCIRFRRQRQHSGPEMEWAKHCLTCPHNTDLQETK